MIELAFIAIDIVVCVVFGWIAISNHADWWDVYQGALLSWLPMASLSIMMQSAFNGAVFGQTWALVPVAAGIHLIAGLITYSGISK